MLQRMNKRRLLIASALATTVSVQAQGLRDRIAGRRGAEPDADAQDLQWRDASRQRSLPLRLRLPAGEAAMPIVLFSHGLGGSVAAGTLWAQAWVRAGFAVLHLQHPGSDGELLKDDGVRGLRQAASAEQLVARAQDVRFVLDELARRQAAGEAPFTRLRLDAIGLAGHSFGAHTTLAVAGQQFGRSGASLTDPRPRAFAAFSPSPGRNEQPAEVFGTIRRPVFCLSGSLDGDPLGLNPGAGRSQDGSWRRAVYTALPAGDKAELWLDGADHQTFGGQEFGRLAERLRPRPAAAVEQWPRHRALIESVSTLWWRAQLLGDAAARATLEQAPTGLGAKDEWKRG